MCSITIPVQVSEHTPAVVPVQRPLASVDWQRIAPCVARAAAHLPGHPDAATVADIVATLAISPDLLPNFENVLPALAERLTTYSLGLDAEGSLYYGKAMRAIDPAWHRFGMAQYKSFQVRSLAALLLAAAARGDEQLVLTGD